MQGFQGQVREQKSGDKLSDIKIIFSGYAIESGGLRRPVVFEKVQKMATSDTEGKYSVSLKNGVYLLIAEHPNFQTFVRDTKLADPGYKTINIYLKKRALTTIYIIRHAEYDPNPGLPPDQQLLLHLNDAGKSRAEQLSKVLCQAGINAVFHTQAIRTKETAQGVITHNNISPIVYYDIPGLINQIQTSHIGENILVVGHTDTVPQIVQALVPGSHPPSIVNEFHNMFIITLQSSCKPYYKYLQSPCKPNYKHLWYGNAPICV